MVANLKEIPNESIVLLHACAHNPTGVDPTKDQWKIISDLCKEKKFTPFFDMAYQGFASGSCDEDAFAVRYFVAQGHKIALSQVRFILILFSHSPRIWDCMVKELDSFLSLTSPKSKRIEPIVRSKSSFDQCTPILHVPVLELFEKFWLMENYYNNGNSLKTLW